MFINNQSKLMIFLTVYRWTDGSAVDYVNWGDNEPNNFHGSEDCVELVVGNGKWNDVNCYSKRNWICKIAKGNSVLFQTELGL